MLNASHTIAAISTAQGQGGIGIVRISGNGALKIAKKICRGVIKPRFANFHNFQDETKEILDQGIVVVCAGLDQDSRGKPWETSAMILGLSDKILKIYGFCNVCGMEATKTYRKEEGGGRTQVGAANIYEPRCLKHWTAR